MSSVFGKHYSSFHSCRVLHFITAPCLCPCLFRLAVGDKARTLGLLLGAGGGYALWQQLPLEQALNGFISVVVFNIIYDLLLRWVGGWLAWSGLACFGPLKCLPSGAHTPAPLLGSPAAESSGASAIPMTLLPFPPTCCVSAARSSSGMLCARWWTQSTTAAWCRWVHCTLKRQKQLMQAIHATGWIHSLVQRPLPALN